MSIAADLEYYLGRKPSSEEVEEAEEWQQDHPGVGLVEYVEAMIEDRSTVMNEGEVSEEIAWQDQPGRPGYFVTKGVKPDTYTIHRRCPLCQGLAHTTVPGPGLWSWEHGEFVQNAFPDLTADQREQVLTGTHSACWDEMMGDPDE